MKHFSLLSKNIDIVMYSSGLRINYVTKAIFHETLQSNLILNSRFISLNGINGFQLGFACLELANIIHLSKNKNECV